MTTNFFSPMSFLAVFGSGIRDTGSGIRDPGWVKIRIRDKHPGAATLRNITGYHITQLLYDEAGVL
jgi:hypothetical protein